MKTEKVAFYLNRTLLRRVRLLARRRRISLSELTAQALTDLVESDKEYQAAKQRHLTLMRKKFDLGTEDQFTWTREELYDK